VRRTSTSFAWASACSSSRWSRAACSPSDYIGQGQTYTYTQATAILSVNGNGGHLSVGTNGDQQWSGDFQTMNTLSQLQPGYYGGLRALPVQQSCERRPPAGTVKGAGCKYPSGLVRRRHVTYLNGFLRRSTCASNSTVRAAVPLARDHSVELKRHHGCHLDPVNPLQPGCGNPGPGSTPATGISCI